MTADEKRELLDELSKPVNALIIAGCGRPELRECWPPEIRRRIDSASRHLATSGREHAEADIERAFFDLREHVLRYTGKVMRRIGYAHNEVGCLAALRCLAECVRQAAGGDLAAVEKLKEIWATVPDLPLDGSTD